MILNLREASVQKGSGGVDILVASASPGNGIERTVIGDLGGTLVFETDAREGDADEEEISLIPDTGVEEVVRVDLSAAK